MIRCCHGSRMGDCRGVADLHLLIQTSARQADRGQRNKEPPVGNRKLTCITVIVLMPKDNIVKNG